MDIADWRFHFPRLFQVHHQLELSPYFFVDVLYVHEPPSEENNCEVRNTSVSHLVMGIWKRSPLEPLMKDCADERNSASFMTAF